MTKTNPCQGKHREFGNFAKTQGILFDWILVLDVAIIATKFPFFLEFGYVWQVCFVYVIVTNYVNWHRENLRLDTENTGNLKV